MTKNNSGCILLLSKKLTIRNTHGLTYTHIFIPSLYSGFFTRSFRIRPDLRFLRFTFIRFTQYPYRLANN